MVAESIDGVPVNQVIAVLLEEGEDASAISAAPAAAPKAEAAKPEAPKPDAPKPEAPKAAPVAAAAPAPVKSQGSDAVTQAAPAAAPGNRVFASPLARRIAKDKGVDLAAVTGSGPHGRSVKADVEGAKPGAAAPAAKPTTAPAAAVAAAPAAGGPGAKALADMLGMTYKQEPLSGMRKVIAKRLTESKQQVPHFYLTVDCELDELLKVRKELNSRSDEYKISVNDFVIRASALALKKVPAANASYDESGLLFYDHADVSVAVATPAGLITPIIKAAEGKGLAAIANQMKDLATRARDGKLKPEEYQGGTFSVSHLGMFGI
jgi:pyruvate dehydrogenase E2 component (dihydrolipoamide acetyltransferase)